MLDDLGAYYTGRGRIDPGQIWNHLQSRDPEVRAGAGRYLLALCRQPHMGGRVNRKNIAGIPDHPGFGERAESEAREIRQYVASGLPEHAAVEMLPAIEWLLKNDSLPKTRLWTRQRLCARSTRSTQTGIMLTLVMAPYPLGSVVAAQALQEVEKLGPVRRQQQHSRHSRCIIAATCGKTGARALAEKWGVTDLPEFKPEAEAGVAQFDGVPARCGGDGVYAPPGGACQVRAISGDSSSQVQGSGLHRRKLGVGPGRRCSRTTDCWTNSGTDRSVPAIATTLVPATLGQWGDSLVKLRR